MTPMQTFSRIWLAILCASLLTACGFTLRGAGATLPPDWRSLHIDSNLPRHEVLTALERRLRYVGVNTEKPTPNARRVDIELEALENRPLFLDAISRTAEMEYSQRATVSVRGSGGALHHGPVVLEVRRVLANDPDNPVGERSETDLVKSELAESLAQRILQQLSRWAEKTDA